MTTTVQPVLSCDQGSLSDISVSLTPSGTTYEVYLGVALLERVGAEPESVARKMLVGRLYNGGRTLRELSERFGHDGRTIKKWAVALRSGDIDVIARAFAGRSGRRKRSPELMRYAWQLYRERHVLGRNFRQIIIERIFEVFGVRLSTTTASAIFAADPKRRDEPSPSSKRANGLQNGPSLSSKPVGSVKQSPISLPVQRDADVGRAQWIHHAGQALFAGQMATIACPLQRQLIGQLLQGAVNIEQSKTLCLRSLAHFTGPVLSVLKHQRDGLDALACEAELMAVYARNAGLLPDGPNRGDVFYFDPHAKEYTGQLKVLKGWCGRRHAVVKSLYLDVFHTRSGRPCFIGHHSPYYDMRERFFMSLKRFDLLFDQEKRQGRTFIIDRGIYSLAVLQSFAADYVITWEKGYQGGGWVEHAPTIEFSRERPRNNSKDLRHVAFQCQQSPWRRDRAFRRILVRMRRQDEDAAVELSVISSHPDMDVQDVVWTICRRWLQENDFKYLDTHFGINQLTSRANTCFRDCADRFEDRPIDSLEYRDLKAQLQNLEGQLGKALVKLRKAHKHDRDLQQVRSALKARGRDLRSKLKGRLHSLTCGRPEPRNAKKTDEQIRQFHRDCRQLDRKLRASANKLTTQRENVASLEERIEPLEAQHCNAIRKQSRLQLLIDGNYRLLDTRRKAMMDALRVTAANIFRNVLEQFRAIDNNFRDDHALVRMLSRCSGTMTRTPDAVTFRIWVPGTIQPYRLRAMEALLEQAQQQTNDAIPNAKSLRIQLATGPQPI